MQLQIKKVSFKKTCETYAIKEKNQYKIWE